MKPITSNTLFYGDNLPILREHIPSESVDLIYLDPPFNSNRSYNLLFKDEKGKVSGAQIEAFDDTWSWGPAAEAAYVELIRNNPGKVDDMVCALRQIIGETSPMMAYLVMMAARLVELHRVLKPTGSLYLHCDPTASHYLKIMLDSVFGPENFQSEIVWQRTTSHVTSKRWPRYHDIILCYSKDISHVNFIPPRIQPDEGWLEREYRFKDERGRYMLDNLTGAGTTEGPSGQPWRGVDPKEIGSGRHWRYIPETLDKLDEDGRIYWPPKGKYPKLKQYLHETGGKAVGDLWTDISVLGRTSAERLGYPTQKPLALLERILQASSNPGDIVLDPFCGCGTTISAAQKLGRRWIGIDVTHLSITLQKYRLEKEYGLEPGKDYDVIGEPKDIGSARQLANDDRYQFQWWALSLIEGARPVGGETGSKQGKKGSDKGIDGEINFIDGPGIQQKKVVIQVKSGHVNSPQIRDLRGVVEREKAAIGVFLTLEPPTSEMSKEAVSAGFYESNLYQKSYPKIQILTVEELLAGKEVDLPPLVAPSFRPAEKGKKSGGEQGKLDL